MPTEDAQENSVNVAEEISALRPAKEKEQGARSSPVSTASPVQEYRGYPNVFRGINTTGSYHVYGDLRDPAGKMECSHNLRCSQVPNPSVAHLESNAIISRPVSSLSTFPSTVTRLAMTHGSFEGPSASMEEDSIQHPQRLSPSYNKGVICSPQSPLRSDCQPNSPTESCSSMNASMSVKQPSDCLKDVKARNWKKYKFIVMNQTPDENGKEAPGCSADVSAASPSQSPPRVGAAGGQRELQMEEGVGEHGEERAFLQSYSSR